MVGSNTDFLSPFGKALVLLVRQWLINHTALTCSYIIVLLYDASGKIRQIKLKKLYMMLPRPCNHNEEYHGLHFPCVLDNNYREDPCDQA